MLLRIKAIRYKSCKRSALSYVAEYWAMWWKDERKLNAAERRRLRIFSDKTLKEKISDDKIRKMTGAIEEFLREQRLRWLRHVERMDNEREPVKTLHFKMDGSRQTEEEMERDGQERDMIVRGLQKMVAQDRTQ